MEKCRACYISALFLLLSLLIYGDGRNSRVLLLNSYHKGYVWSDEITRGIEESFEGQGIDLFVEYMDTKRDNGDSYIDLLESLYRAKYAGTDFDLIMTSDNNAFNFLQDRGTGIFGDKPHVFCGYNHLKPEDIPDPARSTGINEEADLEKAIELILSLHRETEQISIIVENTTSGKKVQNQVREIMDEADPASPTIDLVFDINKEELINYVRNLPDRAVILLTFFFVDRDGITYEAGETAALIRRYSRAPLYGAWNFPFGSGIIGGYLVNGHSQGLRAGKMALQILDGIPVSAIPSELDTDYRLKFDYRELERFSIPLASLPEGAEVFYRPSTFYSRNIRIIWTSLSIFFMQTFLILILIYLNRTKKAIQKKLLSQGILLKQIISNIPSRIYWKDRELKFLGCNISYSKSSGKEEKELIGRRAGEIFPEEDYAVKGEWEETKVLRSEIPLEEREETRTDGEGRPRWFLTSLIPVRDDKGDCIGILGIEEDITSRKNSQLKIEQTEKKLRTIIDVVPQYIFVKNRSGRYLMTNEWASRLEYRQDAMGFARMEDSRKLHEDDLYVLDTGRSLNDIQRQLTTPDGETLWFQMTKILCPPELFEEPAVLGVAMDITALKKAESQLRDREEDLETTLNSIGDGVISTNKSGKIAHMNPVAEKLTGWTTEEARGTRITGVLPLYASLAEKEEIDPVSLVLSEDRDACKSHNIFTVNRKGGELPLNFSCAPILDGQNRIRGVVIVFRDMTEENQLKRQLSHMDKMDTLGQLAGGITHDFNNMIGGIMGASQLMRPYLKGMKTAEEYLDLIVSTSQRAADLTKELLIFSRKRKKASTPFDLEEEIKETVKLLSRTLDKKTAITTELTGTPCPVVGDPSLIQNALMNLGINASHAMPEGGQILIRTEKTDISDKKARKSLFDLQPGTYLKVTFRDTGTGIPKELKDRIFEPFFTTKEEGHGTGLGLSAVYRTVERHGGSIEVKSRINEGTSFIILLPLAEQKGDLKPDTENRIAGTGNVLVVDDDMAMRLTAKEILKDLGYQVWVEEDGRKGLEYYRRNYRDIDLVILDMVMPLMNGKDCFLSMKEINPELKAILTSGFTSEEDLSQMRAEGLNGFCRKPYTIAQLSQVLNEVLHE